MVKVSVVVPVYKVEDYLAGCVDSILAQTFTTIEVILVDDGSPDGSGAICDEYALRDGRVRVIHQINGGVTSARRRGVEEARGEFVCFVDADDTLPPSSIEALYAYAEEHDLDMVMGAYVEVDEAGRREREVRYREGSYSGEDFLRDLLEGASGVPWGNLYRRRLFDRGVLNVPAEIKRSEDFIMKTRLALRAERVGGIPDIVYYYLQRETSAVHTFRSSFAYEKKYNALLFEPLRKAGVYGELEVVCVDYMLRCLRRVLTEDFDPQDSWLMELREAVRRLRFPLKMRLYLRLFTSPLARRAILFAHRHHLKDRVRAFLGRGKK